MNTRNLINEVFADIDSGKFEKASAFLADSFRGVLLGKEVGRPIYISAYRSLLIPATNKRSMGSLWS